MPLCLPPEKEAFPEITQDRCPAAGFPAADSGLFHCFEALTQKGAVRKVCRCEPVTDVTGVAAPRLDGNSLVLRPRCLKIRGIATPACALVRNDRAFSNSPLRFSPDPSCARCSARRRRRRTAPASSPSSQRPRRTASHSSGEPSRSGRRRRNTSWRPGHLPRR